MYTEEGTCAHALCELRLLTALNRPAEQAQREYAALAPKYSTPEMSEAADTYTSLVLQKWDKAQRADKLARIYVERRLDFSSYATDSFGTADCIILSNACMEVIDFKYGKGVEVSAIENPQMMIYALGAYEEFFLDYSIHEVCMTIVQPRIGNVSEYRMPAGELEAWGENTLKPAALAAYQGEGELVAGEHCRFCPVKAVCSAIAFKALDAYRENSSDVKLLPAHQTGNLLKIIPMIEQWAQAVREHGLAMALEGNAPDGFKLVEGRSQRVIDDVQGLSFILQQEGIDEENIYKPRELRAIGDLEKVVGKKRFGELSKPFISKPKGKPTLAPITDKREAIIPDPIEAARQDFAGIED